MPPKKRMPRARTNRRRSHHALLKPLLILCSNCGSPVRPHITCANCGMYKGRQVVQVADPKKKKRS